MMVAGQPSMILLLDNKFCLLNAAKVASLKSRVSDGSGCSLVEKKKKKITSMHPYLGWLDVHLVFSQNKPHI